MPSHAMQIGCEQGKKMFYTDSESELIMIIGKQAV